jgi:NAD(P)-dependent dehydrogenase (short-subunit alcohol dehydrogenase family)
LVVNNAGFGSVGVAVDADMGEYRRMIALNVTALTEVTLAFAGKMASRGDGVVLNVASMAAFTPLPYQSVYGATKAYVVSFSEGVHYEVRRRGVSVLAYCPGPTLTENNDVDGVGRELAEGRRGFFLTAHEVALGVAPRRREKAGDRRPRLVQSTGGNADGAAAAAVVAPGDGVDLRRRGHEEAIVDERRGQSMSAAVQGSSPGHLDGR